MQNLGYLARMPIPMSPGGGASFKAGFWVQGSGFRVRFLGLGFRVRFWGRIALCLKSGD